MESSETSCLICWRDEPAISRCLRTLQCCSRPGRAVQACRTCLLAWLGQQVSGHLRAELTCPRCRARLSRRTLRRLVGPGSADVLHKARTHPAASPRSEFRACPGCGTELERLARRGAGRRVACAVCRCAFCWTCSNPWQSCSCARPRSRPPPPRRIERPALYGLRALLMFVGIVVVAVSFVGLSSTFPPRLDLVLWFVATLL